jgi:hypothetical protein
MRASIFCWPGLTVFSILFFNETACELYPLKKKKTSNNIDRKSSFISIGKSKQLVQVGLKANVKDFNATLQL